MEEKERTLSVERDLALDGVVIPQQERINRALPAAALATVAHNQTFTQ